VFHPLTGRKAALVGAVAAVALGASLAPALAAAQPAPPPQSYQDCQQQKAGSGVAGAIIGGLALGIIETFGAAYISVPYKDGFAFLVLVAFLVFRPQGIFGERVAEKA